MTRSAALLLILFTITIELWLLAGAIDAGDSTNKVSALYAYAWPYLRWLLLLIVLPATVVRLLAKGDFISIRRLDIRTFTNLTDDPELDGANAARRLYRFLSPELGTARPGKTISPGFSETKRPAISISAGVATISLPAIWSHVKQTLLGPDIRLNGMLRKHDGILIVTAWTEDGRELKSEAAIESSSDPLTIAIMQLAEDIKRDLLDLHGEVAEKYQAQLRYEQAAETLERASYPSRKLLILGAWNDLDAHHYEKAKNEFLDLTESRGALCASFARLLALGGYRLRCIATEATVGLARALANDGLFEQAMEYCSSVLDWDLDGNVYMALAEIQSYEGNTVDAIENYDRAERLMSRSITGLSPRKGTSDVTFILNHALRKLENVGIKKRQDIFNTLTNLSQLYIARGRLRELPPLKQTESELQGSDGDAMDRDLGNALQIVTLLSEVMPEATTFHLQLGGRFEDLGMLVDAVESYRRCIAACLTEIQEDPFTIAPQLDMAWAYTGMSACYSMALRQDDTKSGADEDKCYSQTEILAGLAQPLGPDAQQWLELLKNIFNYPLDTKRPDAALDAALNNLAQHYVAGIALTEDLQEEEFDSEEAERIHSTFIADSLTKMTGEACQYESLVHALGGLVDALHYTCSSETINQAFINAEMALANASVNIEAEDLFVTLTRQSELHLKAEGFYGLACLYAIEGKNDDAAGFLLAAIEGVGSGRRLLGFRNRAVLDPDLVALRPRLQFEPGEQV